MLADVAKTLVVVRHAKSGWPDGVVDHERPLNKRGRRDAPAVGSWLAEGGLRPDAALVSSALRTRQTFDLIAAELPDAPAAEFRDDIYHASTGDLLDVVRGAGDDAECVLLIGHNPSVGRLANLLDDESTAVPERGRMQLEFPTSATASFEWDGPWEAINPGEARLIAFGVPRG